MAGKTLNYFEESNIKNGKLPREWQDQISLDELDEFLQLNWEQRSVFFDDKEITTRQQYLGFTGQKGIRTKKYVGTIAFKGHQLNIFPKVFREDKDDLETEGLELSHLMRNLVQWLNYCNKIEYPFINISSRLEDSEDLREFFVTLYLHYVKQALERGGFYRYEEKVEDLSVIKGQINFKDYINNKIPNGLANRFCCSFSEFEFDNSLNRIIKYTCKGLVNSTNSTENKKIIRQILIRMNEVSDIRCIPSNCDRIRLNKLHRQYQILLSMSKMFLLNQTTGYEIDNQESFCFLFPTDLLFEGFIGGFIGEVLADEARVKLQVSDQTLIDNIRYEENTLGRAFTMRHDIVVEHKEKGVFILDTKYKQISRFKGAQDIKTNIIDEVSQSDLYQVIEYAAHRDLSKVYLLYPMYRLEEEEPSDVVLERVSQSGHYIDVYIVRLPFVFEADIEVTKSQLARSIKRIFSYSNKLSITNDEEKN